MLKTVEALEAHFGAKAKIIDISCLEQIKQRVKETNQIEGLNNSQKFYTGEFYELELPKVDFPIRSILLFSFPFPARTLAGFTVDGVVKKFPVCLENLTQYDIVTGELKKILEKDDYHAQFAPKLPRKMLAVSIGLAKYGRTNITYVDGSGSFHSLLPFYTDIPTDNVTLYPLARMESCESCSVCAKVCPNGAINPDRFIIDMERCLTHFNEDDSEKTDFPDWVDKNAHNSVIGCEICQMNCPQNKPYLKNVVLKAVFTQDETNSLLKGVAYEKLTGEFKDKVDALNMGYLLSALPRNLKLLFAKKG